MNGDRGRIHAPTVAILFVGLVFTVAIVAAIGYVASLLMQWGAGL